MAATAVGQAVEVCGMYRRHRGRARSHKGFAVSAVFWFCLCLVWERALPAMAVGQAVEVCGVCRLHRGRARSHKGFAVSAVFWFCLCLVWERARSAWVPVSYLLISPPTSAS